MDQTPQDPAFEESVKQMMRTLPLPTRNYLSQGKYSESANRLATKYGINVDQEGILEREIMLTVMGVEGPNDFIMSLVNEAVISEDTVRKIMVDINQEIFVPLQEEIRKGVVTQQPPKIPVSPMIPRPAAPYEQNPAFGWQTPANPALPSRPGAGQPAGTSWTRPPQPINAPVPRYVPAPPVMKETPKPVANEKLLEDREEPSIAFTPAKTVPPPPNLPGVLRPSEAFSEGGIQPAAPEIKKPVPPASSKPYTVDPYHEPIE
jgi:hypothetical protein